MTPNSENFLEFAKKYMHDPNNVHIDNISWIGSQLQKMFASNKMHLQLETFRLVSQFSLNKIKILEYFIRKEKLDK